MDLFWNTAASRAEFENQTFNYVRFFRKWINKALVWRSGDLTKLRNIISLAFNYTELFNTP